MKTAGHIKGALLEYIVRRLLQNCGFSNAKPDGLYSYERGGLFFINGKGSAHDADVLMNPPFQMPFGYPTQLLFECKAYGPSTKLNIVRGALGLRNDINDFEIVTHEALEKRKNKRRTSLAVENRARFLYQVGVVGLNGFTKDAQEFAANHKIPLLSVEWILDKETLDEFNAIDDSYLQSIPEAILDKAYDYFKDREGDFPYKDRHDIVKRFLRIEEGKLPNVYRFLDENLRHSFVGMLESGDMIFLVPREKRLGTNARNILRDSYNFNGLRARIHWEAQSRNFWSIDVTSSTSDAEPMAFDFFLPDRLLWHWKDANFDKAEALKMKEEMFNRILVFNRQRFESNHLPFSTISLDMFWLNQARQRLEGDI